MAEVFKAKSYTDTGFEKVVALKRLLPSFSEDEAFVQMFLQEARIAARLRHESICPLYELGQVEQDYYLTMEFIYGHDLRATLKALKRKDETMNPWICAFIAQRVATALEYAWTAIDDDGKPLHLVHRDISPQNIMVGFDGSVHVIDFGIAKIANSSVQTAAGVLKGKYAYMSPEHAGSLPLDRRSDIWSLGVVLYEQLSGKRLFIGGSVADTLDQVLSRDIPVLEDVPAPLRQVVERMLNRDLDERYQTHAEVAAALQTALRCAPSTVSEQQVSHWMSTLFPLDKRLEMDLTEQDVRLVFSAEERGEDTTDVQSDISSATRIFLADKTGQADYRLVLEQLMATGRVKTVAMESTKEEAVSSTANQLIEPINDSNANDLLIAVMILMALYGWLLF
jgi:serine/threonine protein kinase